MPCLTLWESNTPTAAVASCFCAIIPTHILTLFTSSELRGQDFVHAHVQLSHVYLVSTLDVTHVINCTRISPSLAGKLGKEAICTHGSHLLWRTCIWVTLSDDDLISLWQLAFESLWVMMTYQLVTTCSIDACFSTLFFSEFWLQNWTFSHNQQTCALTS